MSQKSGKKLKLDKGSLEGGRTYNFSVVVMSEQTNITTSAWKLVRVKSLGPLAKLSASKVTYGTMSNIVLDATLSEDRDNSNGDMTFEWSCRTKDGSGCFVYKGDNPQRLEEYLEAGTLKKDYVVLEKKTLVPGEYLFTVTVTKNNGSSKASVEVVVIPGSPPTISPIALQSKYKPDQGFTVNAVISGAEGTCVQWVSAVEEGFVYLDLALVTRSAKVLCFVRDIPNREYPLVLPDPGPTWPGLQPGARYKFIVSASHPTLGYSEASVVIETLSPPAAGSISVTPATGDGVKTLFTIEAVNFHDEDVPLQYNFGYKDSKDRKVTWIKKISSSLPSIETVLPATESGLTLVVKVCDAFETCTTVETEENQVKVKAADLSDDDILAIGGDVAKKASDQECPEALTLMTQAVKTISLNKNQEATYKTVLCGLYSDVLQQCVDQVSSNLQCSGVETGQEIIEFFIHSPCDLDFTTVESSAQFAGSLADKSKECATTSSDIKTSAVRVERLGFVLADPEAAAGVTNGRSPSKLGFRRRKRQTLANFVTNLVQTLSGEDIEQYINVALKTIDAIEVSIEKDESLNQTVTDLKTKHRGYVSDLLDNIHGNYMAEMCKGATSLSAPDTVRAGEITVNMIKTELNRGADEKFIFDQTKRSLFDASSVKLMEGVYNKYSQWDCGKRDTEGEVLPCVGLCLGTAILETDLVTPSSDRLDTDEDEAPPLVSKIHDVRLLNPVTGDDLTTKLQTEKLEEPMKLQINIENSTKRSGYEFKVQQNYKYHFI